MPKQPIVVPSVCDQYRDEVRAEFGADTEMALFIASKESGCSQAAVSDTNDYCLFQIHNEPATAKSLKVCIRRAHEKFVARGNWSAWYAVCTTDRVAKYEGVKCR